MDGEKALPTREWSQRAHAGLSQGNLGLEQGLSHGEGDGVGAADPAPAPLGTIQQKSHSTMNKGQNLSLHEAEMAQMAQICPKK